MVRFQKNDCLVVSIEETNMLGHGVAKADGAVIFVRNAVAGDEAEIRIIKCAKNYYVARIESLIQPSPHRQDPGCIHCRSCGGCAFQHVTYEHELKLKREYVASQLRKAGLGALEVRDVLTTGQTTGYRNKGMFPVAAGADGSVYCGFYSPKTHRVCKVDFCQIQNPLFSAITGAVCEFLIENQVPVYSEDTGAGLIRHIYLRIAEATGQILLCLVLKEDDFPWEKAFVAALTKRFPAIKSIFLNIQEKDGNVILGPKTRLIHGAPQIEDVLCGKPLRISPRSFYQVNRGAAQLLYRTAFRMANADQFDHVIDLFCGIGSISLSLSGAKRITGIEIVPEAVSDAQNNARLCGAENATFLCGDASRLSQLMEESRDERALVIVDPPRKGLTGGLISDLASSGAQNILYISCSPDTFARDLARFVSLGYGVSAIQPVDLFPRTSHVECIATLHIDNGKDEIHDPRRTSGY